MKQLYKGDTFDIDHLGNKTVISPGHPFVKLFVSIYTEIKIGN